MERFVSGFIRASLVWLGVGVLIGAAMAFVPDRAMMLRPAHMHALLLGFVAMMIFGVAYHVIPRFFGSPLRSRRAAHVHLYVANLGLLGMVGGWVLRTQGAGFATPVLHTGTLLSAVGAALFIVNLWRTMDASPLVAAQKAAKAAPAAKPVPGLPVMR
jgi:heme/copper-type cytochrome/quinol oxidase subunit 1